jgi:hypothetical protein
MKINQYGAVIFIENAVRVEGWLVEREESDPVDATTEQLLLEVAIPWAQAKLNNAIMGELRKISKMRKEAAERLVQN